MGSVDHEYDVLIVGAGIFGTSTAYHLASTTSDPSRIKVLDRATVPSPQAASSDINKIVRADYSKLFYMNLAFEAMDTWYDQGFLRPFYHQTGWIMMDEKGNDLATRIRSNFRECGRPDTSKDISLDEAKRSWGGVLSEVDTTNYDSSYTNSSAGWADASLAVAAMMEEAIRLGVRYETGEVTELVSDQNGLQGVKTTDGRLHTGKNILLATGAWTPWLMAGLENELGIGEPDSVQKQIQTAGVCTAAFNLSEEEARYYGQMPVFIYGEQGESMPPNREGLLKFTNANTFTNFQTKFGRRISIPTTDQHDVPDKLKAQSIELIRRRIPKILEDGRQPDEWRLCWDAVSPDQSQLICQHPDARLSNLYLATAGSFHSWKFLPIIGKYVVSILNGNSNGSEKDEVWKWKTQWSGRGAHEKVQPKVDMSDLLSS